MKRVKWIRWIVLIVLVGVLLTQSASKRAKAQDSPQLFDDAWFFEAPDFFQDDLLVFLETQSGILTTAMVDCGEQNRCTAAETLYYASNTYQYSINIKILLTLIEMQSNLVTRAHPSPEQIDAPMGLKKPIGFENQVTYVGKALTEAHFSYVPGTSIEFEDGSVYTFPTETNAATYAIMAVLAELAPDRASWEKQVEPGNGDFSTTYRKLFGRIRYLDSAQAQFPGNGDPAFLHQPYSGSKVGINSYFDHKYPNYGQNNTVVIYTGQSSRSCAPYCYDGHPAYDYNSNGRNVLATADGVVETVYPPATESLESINLCQELGYTYHSPLYAMTIKHDPDDDDHHEFQTRYWHLASISNNPDEGRVWKAGDTIEKGMVIGPTGNSGCSSGPHLHFEVRKEGVKFDPYGWGGSYTDPWDPNFWLWADSNASHPAETMYIDKPTHNEDVSGVVRISGWAINRKYGPDSGVNQVRIYLDDEAREGQYLGEAVYGDSRPDVGNHFGESRFNESGFHFDWDTINVNPGPHTLYIYARSIRNNNWFFRTRKLTIEDIDRDPPYNPTSVDAGFTINRPGCPSNGNNCWQNIETDPDFTWRGAWDEKSEIGGYYYYWGNAENGTPITWTTSNGFDPGSAVDITGVITHYLRIVTEDTAEPTPNKSQSQTLYTFKYDGVSPTVTLQINNGAETVNQVDVTLDLSTGDTGSGVDKVCVSNSTNDCTDWQPYADTIRWTIPTLNRREHTIYVWVRDKAGNEASASDTITLELYPPKPHSASYRICDDVIDVGGGTGLTSTTYSLVSAIGQTWATGAEANASDTFGGRSGFLSSITGCLPITYAVTSNYTVTQWVIASGGNLRGSASYRLGDTTGQPAASDTNAFTSTSYTLSSGFWAQVTGTVPPTSTTAPPPILPTPTPSPTPGPTPTPQPGGFGVSINEGALYTNDPDVTVSVWAPNVTRMRLSNDGGFADSHWRGYQVTRTWVISTYGSYVMPRFVYAQFRDAQNTIYGTYVDDIIYDPVAPQGQVQVLGSGSVTTTLWMEAYDDNSGVSDMRLTDSLEELDNASWEPYETTRSWVLDNPRVYVQFKDRAGNESLIYDSTGAAHALDSRPTGVNIQGQTSGARDTDHYFIASVSPTTVTLPLTYTWQATGQAPVTHAHQLDASDVVSFTWETAGPKVVTVTAANSLGTVSNVHTINISSLTAEVSKTVTPTGQVDYGDELTYTLVISAEAGTQLGLYDPMTGTTFLRFVEQPAGIDHDSNVITGTLEITPTNQVTVSFVAQVGVPGTLGGTMDVSNRACVYPVGGTIEGDCIWSDEVTNEAFHPYNIFLPLVLRE
jgi:murein DD-endopeptidase MepM/ murein hydrolase activator NlpD